MDGAPRVVPAASHAAPASRCRLVSGFPCGCGRGGRGGKRAGRALAPHRQPARRVPSRCASDARARFPTSCDRSDDNASIKPKMLYASSKDALKKALSGINEEYQATDRGDLDLKEIVKKAGGV